MPWSSRPALSPRPRPQRPANLKNTSDTRPLTFSPCESISSQGLATGLHRNPEQELRVRDRRGGPNPTLAPDAAEGRDEAGPSGHWLLEEGGGPSRQGLQGGGGGRAEGAGPAEAGGRAAGVEGGATTTVGKMKSTRETAFGGQWVDGPEVMGFRNKGNRRVSWKTGNLFPSSDYKERHHFLHV